MKTKKLGVGVIGLGRISARHIDDSIKLLSDFALVAVCDVDKKRIETVGKNENVTAYTNYTDLIADHEVDIVAVCTPNYLHLPIGLACAKYKKHCIMEKPIAQNAQDAEKLIAAFDKAGVTLFPVLQVRYNPVIQIVRNHVKNGNLGKILTAAVIIRWSRPQDYFDESNWKGTKDRDGGALLTQAIHYVDVMQYILGPAKSIFAKAARLAHKIEVEDAANAIIDLKNGTRVSFEFTICTYPQNLECSLTLLGEHGTIKIGGLAMNTCEFWQVKDTPKPIIPEGLTPNVYASGMYVGSCPNHISIYQNAANVLLHKKASFIKAHDALESLRIIDAIKLSSDTKREVTL